MKKFSIGLFVIGMVFAHWRRRAESNRYILSIGTLRILHIQLVLCLWWLVLGDVPQLHAALGQKKWEFQPGGAISKSTGIGTDGTVFVGVVRNTNGGSLYALDSANGNVKWEYQWISEAPSYMGADFVCSPVIGEDNTVYFGYRWKYVELSSLTTRPQAMLCALDGESGKLKWSSPTGFDFTEITLGTEKTIYTYCDYSYPRGMFSLIAVDANSGKSQWGYILGDQLWAMKENMNPPVVGLESSVYAVIEVPGQITTPNLIAVNGTTGNQKWQLNYDLASIPAVGADGTLYFGTINTKFYALDGATGAVRWESQIQMVSDFPPIIGIDGTIYVSGSTGKIIALNGVSGLKVWEFQAEGKGISSPLIGDDGNLYLVAQNGEVQLLNSQSGARIGKFATGSALLGNLNMGPEGNLYVASTNGCLYAYGTSSTGLANSPWPKIRADAQNRGRPKIPANLNTPPVIISQSHNILCAEGGVAQLFVAAQGEPPLRYDWYMNDELVSGVYGSQFLFTNISSSHAGTYSVRVSNRLGQIRSEAMALKMGYKIQVVTIGPGRVNQNPSDTLFSRGTQVELTAVPDPGKKFMGWSGDTNSQQNPLILTMDRSWKLQAAYGTKPGELLWQYFMDYRVHSPPALGANGLIYVTSGIDGPRILGKVCALDNTGKMHWEYVVDGYVPYSPVIGSNNTIYVAMSYDMQIGAGPYFVKGKLIALDGLTGIKLKEISLSAPLAARPRKLFSVKSFFTRVKPRAGDWVAY